jgi:glycosyltransferase involved in cell wall biosynthesis
VISTYNRSELVTRCIESCFAQTFSDFEVVVVDDASTDGTEAALSGRYDGQLRLIVHDANRGIDPTRYTGVSNARGEWILVLDSDWELLPGALQRLHEIISALPPHIRVVGSRLLLDDGRVTPSVVPEAPTGYEDRIRWVEEEGGNDEATCVHRSVFERTPYFSNRRGAMETLYQFNLAKSEITLHVQDVLGREHFDAPNSYLRDLNRRDLIPRLLREAPDMLWMVEATLADHGAALRALGPRQYRIVLRRAASQAFLVGDRRRGVRYSIECVRRSKGDLVLWSTVLLGLVSPKVLAHGMLAHRWATRLSEGVTVTYKHVVGGPGVARDRP